MICKILDERIFILICVFFLNMYCYYYFKTIGLLQDAPKIGLQLFEIDKMMKQLQEVKQGRKYMAVLARYFHVYNDTFIYTNLFCLFLLQQS